MKVHSLLPTLAGALAWVLSAQAQTTTTFAPTNFSDIILTSTPSNATGSSGVSSVFSSNGTTSTFGTGGALVNPALFNYSVTSPTTATITMPASGSTAASTTNLTFTSATGGTYVT